jgi:uncharacterized protein DUF5989
MNPAKRLIRALWASRKHWLLPVLMLVVLLAGLTALSEGQSFRNFIYSRF